jgi:lipoprotein-anchoring transpeptidase ErfK/SrfK
MNSRNFARALAGALLVALPLTAAQATFETAEHKAEAASAAATAKDDMQATFGKEYLRNGEHLWKKTGAAAEVTRVVIDLSDQLAFAYRDDQLIGVSTISSGTDEKPTPTGIFPILEKRRMHHSIKDDNAPMPFMQRLDDYGVALHAGKLPGYPASHGCVRLPAAFAAKLFAATSVGTVVMIGKTGEDASKQPTEPAADEDRLSEEFNLASN